MNFDERVFCLVSPYESKIGAIGVRLLDRADFLIGIYMFWNDVDDTKRFLNSIVRDFGEARLYSPCKTSPPGLVCKMSVSVPSLILIGEECPGYYRLKLDLLEIRASNPRPFLALHYDSRKRAWDYKPLLALRCVDSNYSYIPN